MEAGTRHLTASVRDDLPAQVPFATLKNVSKILVKVFADRRLFRQDYKKDIRRLLWHYKSFKGRFALPPV